MLVLRPLQPWGQPAAAKTPFRGSNILSAIEPARQRATATRRIIPACRAVWAHCL